MAGIETVLVVVAAGALLRGVLDPLNKWIRDKVKSKIVVRHPDGSRTIVSPKLDQKDIETLVQGLASEEHKLK
jgi:hypothetical protein